MSCEKLRCTDLTRRRWLSQAAACIAAPSVAMLSGQVMAGQVEEPLSHSVKTALTAAVNASGTPKLHFEDDEERQAHGVWLAQMSERLKSRITDEHRRVDFLETVKYESRRAGLETALVMGLIQTESAFRQYAVSVAGALGYMQVMPFWTKLIGDGDTQKLFRTQINLRYGCVILRHYLDMEKGDLFLALGRYNGSRGQSKYPNSVYGHRKNWMHEPKAATAG